VIDRIGMVGLGLMGSAISAGCLRAGYRVRGYDVDARRLEEHVARGGESASSAADAARGMRRVILSLPNIDIVRDVIFGPGGVVEGAEPGLLIIDTTTPRPESSEAIAAELAERGIRFVDACVSGTSKMAWNGDLIVIAGGEDDDFETALPILKGFSRAAYHMGPVGSGGRTKLIINLVLAGNRLALAEGLALGTKLGMDVEQLLGVLQDSAASSKTMVDKGPKMIRGEYGPEGHVRSSLKDSRLMIEQGQRVGAPMLVTSVYSQVLQAALEQGDGDRDTVAMFEVFRQLAGLPRRT
jgi:3-hydroxyisobutyrate dehydrogenase-like beta-hydroxyacid dehydrogenase